MNWFIIALFLSLNGQGGMKYGIPFCIQARASFGVHGSKLPQLFRIVPAIAWYGVGTWIAALSMDGILRTVLGIGETGFTTIFIYFLILQAAQTWLAYKGVRLMKWFTVTASIAMFIIMLYMLIHIFNTYGFEIKETWKTEGTWGAPFWIALTASIGAMATLLLNISDLSRYLQKSQKNIWLGHLIGIVPPWFFMIFLGLVAGAAMGEWNPIAALMKLSPGPVTMLLLLFFIFTAQFSTNLTLNILPPALILEDVFHIRWGMGTIITGVLGVLAVPWVILSNMAVFFGFITYYSAFFGPILGVMLADYYVCRKQRYNPEQLYVADSSGQYWYTGGINWAGILSMLIAGLIAMIWWLAASWLVGLPLGFVFYLILFPIMVKNRYPQAEIA